MTESVVERFRRSEIAELLARYPELRLVPSGAMTLRVEGTLRFCANGKKTEVIEDGYDIRIEAPENFPDRMALAWETAGRIPSAPSRRSWPSPSGRRTPLPAILALSKGMSGMPRASLRAGG